jgi:hypothetical protein
MAKSAVAPLSMFATSSQLRLGEAAAQRRCAHQRFRISSAQGCQVLAAATSRACSLINALDSYFKI